jgi:hypothetical protein
MPSRPILWGTVSIAALAGAVVGLVGGHAIKKGKPSMKALSAVPAADVHTIATKIPSLRTVALPASLREPAASTTSSSAREGTATTPERSSTASQTTSPAASPPTKTTKATTKSGGELHEESGGGA